MIATAIRISFRMGRSLLSGRPRSAAHCLFAYPEGRAHTVPHHALPRWKPSRHANMDQLQATAF
jgi:hypothetical protein